MVDFAIVLLLIAALLILVTSGWALIILGTVLVGWIALGFALGRIYADRRHEKLRLQEKWDIEDAFQRQEEARDNESKRRIMESVYAARGTGARVDVPTLEVPPSKRIGRH